MGQLASGDHGILFLFHLFGARDMAATRAKDDGLLSAIAALNVHTNQLTRVEESPHLWHQPLDKEKDKQGEHIHELLRKHEVR